MRTEPDSPVQRSRWLLVLALCFPALAPPAVVHAADDLSWSEPVAIELPAPGREIELEAGVDALAWVQRYGLGAARLLPLGQGRTLVETELAAVEWQQLVETACREDGVRRCADSRCQQIQLAAEVTPGHGRDAQSIQGRIVRSPPEALLSLKVDAVDDTDPDAGQCRAEPLAGLLDEMAGEPASGGLGQDLMLDLDLASKSSGRGRERAYEVDLNRAFNAAGGADLSPVDLPADSSGYQLELAAGCSTVSLPLDAVEPAFLPGVVVALVDAGTAAAVASQNGLAVLREVELTATGETLAVFATSSDLPGALLSLGQDSRVRRAQREYVYRTSAVAGDYSDPYARFTYGPERTGARRLHRPEAGATPLVAVIDAGVDGIHPEFEQRITVQDATGTQLVPSAHGTAVAGIIAAAADNGVGIYGAAPGARVLALQACLPREPGSLGARCRTSTLLKALDLAIAADARIINMSLAGPPDPLLERFINLALSQDRLIIAGAGNGGPHAKPGYPAALPGVVAVTAIDARDDHFEAANQGDYVELAAPGVDILSPTPDGRYPPLSGTSMATAQVAGVAALLLERDPNLGGRALRNALAASAMDIGAPGRDPLFGFGVVDACQAAEQLNLEAIGSCGIAAAEGGQTDAD